MRASRAGVGRHFVRVRHHRLPLHQPPERPAPAGAHRVARRADAGAGPFAERVLHRPVPTDRHTFTFVREIAAQETYDADTSAEVIAAAVETMRRQARLDTDRLAAQWEAASSVYAAAMYSARDDEQRLAAKRTAAKALSDHINASLLEPPLVE